LQHALPQYFLVQVVAVMLTRPASAPASHFGSPSSAARSRVAAATSGVSSLGFSAGFVV
jgi:hypothetical protein